MADEDRKSPEEAGFSPEAPFTVQTEGLELTFYADGADRLDALLTMIGQARESIRAYYYIFARDECAASVRDALTEAAQRGVKVTLILDDFGSTADSLFLSPLLEAGGQFRRFSPHWGTRYLIRNHQKMLIADGERALIGGFNIEKAYFDPPEVNGWNDLGVCVKGEAVAHLAAWFDLLNEWTSEQTVNLRRVRQQVRQWQARSGQARWLVGGPSRRLSPWAESVIKDIERACQLDMIMAYFSPRGGLARRLGRVATRGKANFVLAGKSDNAATIGASRAHYGRLLKTGADIYEFQPCKLHTKLVVVDDAVYIGSANFDMRSLYINLEIMLRVEDAELADRMRAFIARHEQFSTHVTPQVHRQRLTIWNRLRWTMSWWLVSVVDYTVTRRLNLGL